ncbi:MAG: hypothetical protein ACRD1R_14425 [Acidobacteriota bacterium]
MRANLDVQALASEGLYPPPKRLDPPMRNLALGILLQAFRDLVTPRRAASNEWKVWRQDALEWFLSEDSYPGSFRWVCDVLQMDAVHLRQWIHRYRGSENSDRRRMVQKLIHFRIPH